MKKLMLLAAIAVGYVLGARAGRERYEQIRSGYRTVKSDPRVQQAAATVSATAKEQAPVVKEKVGDLAASAKDTVQEKTSGGSGGGQGSADSDLVEELHPDSTARQENPYPQGDLP